MYRFCFTFNLLHVVGRLLCLHCVSTICQYLQRKRKQALKSYHRKNYRKHAEMYVPVCDVPYYIYIYVCGCLDTSVIYYYLVSCVLAENKAADSNISHAFQLHKHLNKQQKPALVCLCGDWLKIKMKAGLVRCQSLPTTTTTTGFNTSNGVGSSNYNPWDNTALTQSFLLVVQYNVQVSVYKGLTCWLQIDLTILSHRIEIEPLVSYINK